MATSQDFKPDAGPTPPRASIEANLEKILSSPNLTSAPSLRRFLRFIVDRTLEGCGEELKEYVLGVEVFDRGPSFDPRTDAIVRVQGSKLRSRLHEYYAGPGKSDSIIIELPKGSYVPVFRFAARPIERKTATFWNQRWLWIAAGIVAIVFGFYKAVAHRKPKPAQQSLTRLTYHGGLTRDAVISPDGRFVAYASDRSGAGDLDIWLQQIGGDAVRVTTGESNDREPEFSPDGRSIVFSSDRDGGGIFSVPMLGGPVRKLAAGGRRPRLSTDGKHLVYHEGPEFGRLLVIPANGGTSRTIVDGFQGASPIWLPDSRHVLFFGRLESGEKKIDWWVASTSGEAPVRTNLRQLFEEHNLEIDVRVFADWIWYRNQLIFSARKGDSINSARKGDSINLWTVPMSPLDWRAKGTPERLTFGAGRDVNPSISADGRLIFTTIAEQGQIWSVHADQQKGVVLGDPGQVVSGDASNYWPSASADGKRIVFASSREGHWGIWRKDRDENREVLLTAPATRGVVPIINSVGTQVAYGLTTWSFIKFQGPECGVGVISAEGGEPKLVLSNLCAWPTGWSPDGRLILYHTGAIGWIDPARNQATPLVKGTTRKLWNGHFSPNGKYVAFGSADANRGRVYIVPFPAGAESSESNWIPVTEGTYQGEGHPQWSPGGNLLYFPSDRDGNTCLWARGVNQTTGQPYGTVFPVYHSHAARRSIGNVASFQFSFSAVADQIIFGQAELTGNVWLTNLPGH